MVCPTYVGQSCVGQWILLANLDMSEKHVPAALQFAVHRRVAFYHPFIAFTMGSLSRCLAFDYVKYHGLGHCKRVSNGLVGVLSVF